MSSTKQAAARSPQLEDFTNDLETIAQFRDKGPDGFGRRTFMAFWIANNVGWSLNEHGVRAQVFVTDPDKFAARQEQQGRTVRFQEDTVPVVVCPRCGHPRPGHGMVHVRHGNGGGHNEPCPESRKGGKS